MAPNVQRDHGYAWVIVAVCALTTCLFKGAQHGTMGVLLVEWMDYFDQPYSVFTTLSAVFYCPGNFLAPIAGVLIKRYGARINTIVCSLVLFASYTVCTFVPLISSIYIFFGFFAGIGFNGMFLAGNVITLQYFDKRRGLAQGILSTFIGIGILIWPVLISGLVQLYAWHGALLVQAAIFANGVIGGFLMRPFPVVEDPQKSLTLRSELQTMCKQLNFFGWKGITKSQLRAYLIYLGASGVQTFGMQLSLVYSPKRAVNYGISNERAAFLVSIIGFFAPTRLLFGWIGDHKNVNRLILVGLCTVIAGVLNTLSVVQESYIFLLGLQVPIAICNAGVNAAKPVIMVDILGTKMMAVAFGFNMFVQGLAVPAIHVAAGPILQFLGFRTLFMVFGLCQVFGGILFFCSFVVTKKAATEIVPDVIQL